MEAPQGGRDIKRTHRIMIWTDEAGNPTQAAVGVYLDDDKASETTWTPEPFFGVTDVARQAYEMLAIQMRLW